MEMSDELTCPAPPNRNLPKCRLIKADVEGMEVEVIKGAVKTIKCLPMPISLVREYFWTVSDPWHILHCMRNSQGESLTLFVYATACSSLRFICVLTTMRLITRTLITIPITEADMLLSHLVWLCNTLCVDEQAFSEDPGSRPLCPVPELRHVLAF